MIPQRFSQIQFEFILLVWGWQFVENSLQSRCIFGVTFILGFLVSVEAVVEGGNALAKVRDDPVLVGLEFTEILGESLDAFQHFGSIRVLV